MRAVRPRLGSATLVEDYVAQLRRHLARLTAGQDPVGHLFAIERLTRAARTEWWWSR
jgi:hypothetical protein